MAQWLKRDFSILEVQCSIPPQVFFCLGNSNVGASVGKNDTIVSEEILLLCCLFICTTKIRERFSRFEGDSVFQRLVAYFEQIFAFGWLSE